MADPLKPYRRWFMAAAIYNLLWGAAATLFPLWFYRIGGLDQRLPTPLFQSIGMMVGVYAYGYYLLAKDPIRYCGMVWVGLAGKLFGPIGFLFSAWQGTLPWSFGWINLTNDVIWLPAFIAFAWKYARHPLNGHVK
ncbi:alkyl hydroperoxide reductase [bacterium]|nr:MAG: alkyl hydroperoxide reductase [bacterium]